MTVHSRLAGLLLVGAIGLPVAAADELARSPDGDRHHQPDRPIDFVRDVRPILTRHCDRCHGPRQQESGLRLDRAAAVFASADSGEPIVVPGESQESHLLKRITDDQYGDLMPLDGQPLAAAEIATLRDWIEQGANWPDPDSAGHDPAGHWAYQPIQRPKIPAADSHRPIDFLIDQQLAVQGLQPSRPLDRGRWFRRVSLALVGIPPQPEDVDAFVRDTSPNAHEKVVDRLLQSPRYGERWAIPWLDGARYADSNGFQADQIRDNWAYRDWVIRAFNADLPMDRFVIDQIAGDLHREPTIDQRIATGFHRMTTCNVEAGVHPEANRVNQVVDRVNTTATLFLGTTLECAQCHDHKYDPFSTIDYYRLFACFNNTPLEVENTSGVTWDFYGPTMDVPPDESVEARREHARAQRRQLQAERGRLKRASEGPFQSWLETRTAPQIKDKSEQELRSEFNQSHPPLKKINDQIRRLDAEIAQLESPTTLVMVEMEQPRETFVMIRGDYENRGAMVEPGVPASLAGAESSTIDNRMDLALWLTSADNPLTARVMVNRWWAELFGRGIVSTPEDFGSQGEPPTHPELLDFLASELIRSGWSMKQTLRLMVLSESFARSPAATSQQRLADPDNRWLSRGPRFRLPAELVRDNALAISGLLSDRMHGPPIMPYQPDGIWRSVGRNQPEWNTADGEDRFRRGVYVVWKRAAPYPSFVTFDAPDRSSCTVQRGRSNTPLQALTLLNDPAYTEMALAFAARIIAAVPSSSDLSSTQRRSTDRERVEFAVRVATARSPSAAETELLVGLLNQERQALAARPELVAARLAPLTDRFDGDCGELASWFAVANALLNADEVLQQ